MCVRRGVELLLFLSVLGASDLIDPRVAHAKDVDLPGQWKDLDFKQFCPRLGERPQMHILARALASNYQIPLSLLDWNDTGITYSEYRAALSIDLCLSGDAAKRSAKCLDKDGNPTKDAIKQANAPFGINRVLADGGSQFDVVLKGGILRFKYRQRASVLQVRNSSRIAAADDKPTLAEELFSTTANSYDVMCVAKEKGPPPFVPSQPSDAPALPSAEDAKLSKEAVFDRIRVRGSPDDLSAGRDNADTFKSASSATLSVNNDNSSQKNTFDGHLALGYAIPSPGIGRLDFVTIPYVKIDRTYTTGTGAPTNSPSVENVGFGLQENILFPFNGIYGTLSIRPDYTYSTRSAARIGKLQVSYEPYPSWKVFGQPAPIGSTDIIGYVTARAIVNVGRVFDPGTDEDLAATKDFSQGGGAISAIFSVDDNSDSMFKGFSVPITYTYLYGFVGEYKAIPQFTVGVEYSLAKYVNVGASHTWGRNLDTFEKQNLYKLKLGLKY